MLNTGLITFHFAHHYGAQLQAFATMRALQGLGFTCEIILGVGEAAIFSGGLGVYLYAGTFLLLRNLCQPEAGMEAAP